jgi:hypothetical protein
MDCVWQSISGPRRPAVLGMDLGRRSETSRRTWHGKARYGRTSSDARKARRRPEFWSAVTKAALRAGCGTAFSAALKAASRVPHSGTLAARTPDPERLSYAAESVGQASLPVVHVTGGDGCPTCRCSRTSRRLFLPRLAGTLALHAGSRGRLSCEPADGILECGDKKPRFARVAAPLLARP